MSVLQRALIAPIIASAVFAQILAIAPAAAQTNAAAPLNAYASEYGPGWECDLRSSAGRGSIRACTR
jgi:hypothetical protein